MTEVVAALVWEKGKFMICRRPAHKSCGLLWEFVGGKVEPGETKEQALIRECREELGITVAVGSEFMQVTHKYPDIVVHLTLFNASIESGEIQMLEHCDIQWITPDEIEKFDFCPADESILERITTDYNKKKELFNRQKHMLDTFLERGAITKTQFETSMNGLREKMEME